MDIHTLHVEHAVFLALYTVLTVANSWLYKGMKGVRWFSLYSALVFLGATAVALRGHIPDFASIVLGNLFVVAGYSALLLCLADFLGNRKISQIYFQMSLLLLAIVTMLQYGWLQPNTSKRLIAYSIVLACQHAQIALFLYRNRTPTLRIPIASMTLMMFGLFLANLIRIAGVVMHGAPHNYLNAGAFLQWVLIINSCLQWGAMVAFVWMTAATLRGKLEAQAATDSLTGTLNRRGIELAAEQCIFACRKDSSPLSALVIDLDDFKRINDSFGHHCGDATLIAVAACLQRGMRKGDLLARIGGDEFAVLLPNTSHTKAAAITELLRESIAKTEIIYGIVQMRVTASFGLAELQPQMTSWEQLFMRCDKALYEEKQSDAPEFPATNLPNTNLGLFA
ncbi:MAG TPA: GGDEF domain-containing protein [Edaphobacter sp.]|nr:GGDEF domain-containing protein [Edaphobacter sp.]